jgi:hypothetical protein
MGLNFVRSGGVAYYNSTDIGFVWIGGFWYG